MQRGPKAEPPSTKLARGTFQRCRDGGKVEILSPGDPPAMPPYLRAAAKKVWEEEIGRVMMAGACELDSSLFGRYCSMEALVRAEFKAGRAPPAAFIAQLRQHAELLGIAGRKSRVGKLSDRGGLSNTFTRNGTRPFA